MIEDQPASAGELQANEDANSGRWKPGRSGNPSGRKAGTGVMARLRERIEEHIPAIIESLAERAKAGDPASARLLLERGYPPFKAAEQPAPIDLPDGALAEQGRAVLMAAANGELAPGQAAQLLAGLGSLAKLIETDELTARIAALEARNVSKATTP